MAFPSPPLSLLHFPSLYCSANTVIIKYRSLDLVDLSPNYLSISLQLLSFCQSSPPSAHLRIRFPLAPQQPLHRQITMAPKKDAGKAQGSSTKVAVDKVSIRPSPPQ